MATFRQRGCSWRAEVYKHGHRASATFATRQKAVTWAKQRERELSLLPWAAAQPRRLANSERDTARDAARAFCSLRAA